MAKKNVTKSAIQKGYMDYMLKEARIPETVTIFTEYLNISEASFYELFGSLEKVESTIWEDYYNRTLKALEEDEEFEQMTAREKHLSFLYTLLEVIKSDRSYIMYRLLRKSHSPIPKFLMNTMGIVTHSEIDWVSPPSFLPEKGTDIAKSSYRAILWKHSVAMIRFWIKDDSAGGEDTDAFIEKSTRTLFDVGELPALDSLIDFGKFFLQKMGFAKADS